MHHGSITNSVAKVPTFRPLQLTLFTKLYQYVCHLQQLKLVVKQQHTNKIYTCIFILVLFFFAFYIGIDFKLISDVRPKKLNLLFMTTIQPDTFKPCATIVVHHLPTPLFNQMPDNGIRPTLVRIFQAIYHQHVDASIRIRH